MSHSSQCSNIFFFQRTTDTFGIETGLVSKGTKYRLSFFRVICRKSRKSREV